MFSLFDSFAKRNIQKYNCIINKLRIYKRLASGLQYFKDYDDAARGIDRIEPDGSKKAVSS